MDSEGYITLVKLIQGLIPGHWIIHALGVLLLLKLANVRISGKIIIEWGKKQLQEKPETTPSYSAPAKTIPSSNSDITLRFTVDDGETIKVTQLEGGMIRIEKDGSVLGITPNKAMNNVA